MNGLERRSPRYIVDRSMEAMAAPRSDIQLGFRHLLDLIVVHGEPDFPGPVLHLLVFYSDRGDNARQSFVPADLPKPPEQLGAEALALPCIDNHQSKFALPGAVYLDQASDREN